MLKALILIIVGAILLANLYCLAAGRIFKVKAPTVFGCSSAVVLTGSMSGTIEPDDFIITHKQSDYTVGDIVMYQTGGTPVTHRIISENEKGYRTKGDANNTDDGTEYTEGGCSRESGAGDSEDRGGCSPCANTYRNARPVCRNHFDCRAAESDRTYSPQGRKTGKLKKQGGGKMKYSVKNRAKAEIPASFFRRFALSSADCGGGVRRDLFKICNRDNGGRYGKSGNHAGYHRYRNRKFRRDG